MADYSSDISFTCPGCGATVEDTVLVPEPNWTEDKAIDRVTTDEIEIECPECEESFYADVTNSDGSIYMTFTEHPTVEIECGMGSDRAPDGPDDYWDEIPESPAYEFRSSVNDALALLDEHGTDWTTSTVNRMVFIHCFAALEAFFGDTLFNHIKSGADALLRVVDEDKELKERKITLAMALKDRDIVLKEVSAHLRSILYHNLSKVSGLYKIACKIDIFPDDIVKTALFKALPLRHDCVHRNGKDKEGNLQYDLKRPYVRQIADHMKAMVDHIEKLLPQ